MKNHLRVLVLTLLAGLQIGFAQTSPTSTTIQTGTFDLGGKPVTGKAVRDLTRYPKTSVGDAAFKAKAESSTRPFAVTVTSGTRNGQVLAALGSEPGTEPTNPTVPVVDDGTYPGSTAPAATAVAQTYPKAFTYSETPNRINRMQSLPRLPVLDGWKMKQCEVVLGGNGGINETPDELRKRGHTWFKADWFFFQQTAPPWGLPKSTDNLFFEYTGAFWGPYHRDPINVLVHSMDQIAQNVLPNLPRFNSTEQNGLINGVPTVKEGHYNIEFQWFTNENWNQVVAAGMQNTTFKNYANGGAVESFQQVYNRGGAEHLNYALQQKWKNIIFLSTKFLNAKNNGMKHYYGDFYGIAPIPDVRNWYQPYSIQSLFSSDVNDGGKFEEANQQANAGNVTLNIEGNNEVYNVSGNLRELFQIGHCYSYEFGYKMSQSDYNAYQQAANNPAQQDVRLWYDKQLPDLARPYNMALHSALTTYVKTQKGWPNYKEYWQKESIYEFNITSKENNAFLWGAFVPWAPTPNSATKTPLHPEVVKNIVFLSRMVYDGLFMWGSTSRINPDEQKGENLHPKVHAVSREAEQAALDELAQYEQVVFRPDQRRHILDIPVLNPQTNQYVTGGPHILAMANGNNFDQAVPLVVGVDSPSTGWELYFIYAPNATRTTSTSVTWKSPIDGAVLSGTATGWGGKLYARKR